MKKNKSQLQKIKKKENDPNHNFDESQHYEINKDFYDYFLDGYFFLKVSHLYSLKRLDVDKQKELFNFELMSLKTDDQYKYSKHLLSSYISTELVMNTFHCMETFVRLYIAHSAGSECPNLILANLSIDEYQKNITAIQNNKFNYMRPELSDDEVIAETYYHGLENVKLLSINKKQYSVEQILNLRKEYLVYAANFLRDNKEYNTYKHGFYLNQNDNGFEIKNDNGVLSARGSSFEFISITREKGKQATWTKNIKFFDEDMLAIVTIAFELYMTSMVRLWGNHYLGKHQNEPLLIPFEIEDFLKVEKENINAVDNEGKEVDFFKNVRSKGMSMEYRYFLES
ncbi:hypothetical protein [Fundicoccus ignavus]|uniref:Uncharacterized protein n=1 Tax=Fundicoccus ignavus TaxID=2664442 RepID=A0A844BY55_9LACT|nr:hypothetical protein [Fundicoccus ignavus]MRJ46944.1 hypothetical protein [Fundicoccus ignavus]